MYIFGFGVRGRHECSISQDLPSSSESKHPSRFTAPALALGSTGRFRRELDTAPLTVHGTGCLELVNKKVQPDISLIFLSAPFLNLEGHQLIGRHVEAACQTHIFDLRTHNGRLALDWLNRSWSLVQRPFDSALALGSLTRSQAIRSLQISRAQ